MERLTKRVKIYSNEHQAWWKPNYSGYTKDESKAGVFEIEDVYKNYGTNQITFDTNKEDYFVEVIGLTKSEQLAKYKHLEEQIGCPLEVRCKVVCGSIIYDYEGNEHRVMWIENSYFIISNTHIVSNLAFDWKDYGVKWFLRKDKSE